MNICLIGPSYPFRGGITHHTTLLYRHLRKRHHVTFYAFRRQYPQWLFPGETDRDTSQVPLREEGVQAILDSLNPLTWWEVYRRIHREKPDLLIIPWWTSFWALQFWTILTLLKRSSPTKILFICHNVVDHDPHFFSRACARTVLKHGDHFFVHSENDGMRLREIVPSAHITHSFHPLYDFLSNRKPSRTEARNRLGLQGDTILFFGFIRPYKGVDDLLKAMPLIIKQRNVTLLVVGEFWEGRQAFNQQIRELGLEDAVRVVDKYVPNEEVGLYFSAADLVVLPYVSGTGSGVVQMAYGLEKPVIATRVGSLPEVVEDGRTGYLVNPGDARALANAVTRFFSEEKEAEFIENIKRIKGKFSWEQIVRLIEESTSNEDQLIECEKSICTPQ